MPGAQPQQVIEQIGHAPIGGLQRAGQRVAARQGEIRDQQICPPAAPASPGRPAFRCICSFGKHIQEEIHHHHIVVVLPPVLEDVCLQELGLAAMAVHAGFGLAEHLGRKVQAGDLRPRAWAASTASSPGPTPT